MSKKSNQKTSNDLAKYTFSLALEAGLTHYNWLDGETNQRGQEAVPANHSQSQENTREQPTKDTYGPLFDGLLTSANLQSFLENRLRARLEGRGSPEYALTWKHWDMKSGLPICALRASTPRTLGKDCGGSQIAGWPKTPLASDGEGGVMEIRPGTGRYKLRDWAHMVVVGWPTATVRDYKDHPNCAITAKKKDGKVRNRLDTLGRVAGQTSGTTPYSTPAKTESGGVYRLNPYFSLWLMGFPKEWTYCGVLAMQSFRKSRK